MCGVSFAYKHAEMFIHTSTGPEWNKRKKKWLWARCPMREDCYIDALEGKVKRERRIAEDSSGDCNKQKTIPLGNPIHYQRYKAIVLWYDHSDNTTERLT